jgi:hypothetical protein
MRHCSQGNSEGFSGRGSHDGSATTGAERHHEHFCTDPLELAVVAGHHINPGEPPDFSSCFGDHSLALTAFQIRGRVFEDVGSNEMGRGGHRAILRRASCHLLRGKTAISEEFVRNLLSDGPDAGACRPRSHSHSGPPTGGGTAPCGHASNGARRATGIFSICGLSKRGSVHPPIGVSGHVTNRNTT